MHIVQVYIEVKPDCIEDFIEATIMNAKASLNEPGIARFDILQDQSDPNLIVLNEVYRTPMAPAKHKETEHYNRWKETVANMLVSPRTRKLYNNIFPKDDAWD